VFSLRSFLVAGKTKAMDMPDRKAFHFPYQYHGLTKTLMREILIKAGNRANKRGIFTGKKSI